MAKSGGSKAAGKRKAKGKQASAVERMMADQRRRISAAYAECHPERAAEERALRKAHAAAQGKFGHKRNGTVETHAAAATMRQGALARLHRSGAISNDQLGWALEIQAEHERIDAAVGFCGASLETRVDISRNCDAAFFETLGAVRRAMAYTRWRNSLSMLCSPCLTGAQHVLEMVVADLGVTWGARRLRMSVRRARKVLIDALDMWPSILRDVSNGVDEQDLLLAHRRIGVY